METIKFLKLKHFNSSIDVIAIPSLRDIVEWTRMSYARDLYWIKANPNYKEINELPRWGYKTTEEAEQYFDDEWNYRLTQINKKQKKGELLDYEINSNGVSAIIVVDSEYGKFFLEVDKYDIELDDSNVYEDVTDEYYQKLINLINPKEIEEFVNSHDVGEIEEKYGGGYSSEMWTL